MGWFLKKVFAKISYPFLEKHPYNLQFSFPKNFLNKNKQKLVFTVKDALSGLRQFLATQSLLKNI